MSWGAGSDKARCVTPFINMWIEIPPSYGAYGRLVNSTALAGRDNRFTLGLTWSAGKIDAQNSVNVAGKRLEKLSASKDTANNLTAYAENAWNLTPDLAVITGLQD